MEKYKSIWHMTWDADILWTHKFDNWVNKEKPSGMLPVNWFPDRDLKIKKKQKTGLRILVQMDIATDDLLNTTRKSWI